MKKPIILVDMSNLFFRMHYAHRTLSSNGKPTGVLFGVLRNLHDLREHVSKRILFCWDNGVPVPGAERPKNWRDAVMPSYKATRVRNAETWDAVCPQLPELHRVLEAIGYHSVSVMGLEADDVIGILAHEFDNDEVLIFSTDKDMYQCLSPHDDRVQILVPQKHGGKFQRVTAARVLRDFSVPVHRWAEYLALGGDSADNIKPMRGMGPVTATKLIQAGADLCKSFDEHPAAFQAAQKKYREVWPEILKSYEVARVPTSWSDRRIAKCSLPVTVSPALAEQSWPSERMRQSGMEYFTRFCADREMLSLLGLRHKFFEQGEQECFSKLQVPMRRAVRKSLF